MKRRLRVFLPVVLLALLMQVLAPIAVCWAASAASVDPLRQVSICHGSGDDGSDQPDRRSTAHHELCAFCISHAATAMDAPSAQGIVAHPGQILIVLWPEAVAAVAGMGTGSNSWARGPPAFA